MKSINVKFITFLAIIITTVSSCQAIGDIFKAGVWVGVVIVALVIGIIFWLINKAKK